MSGSGDVPTAPKPPLVPRAANLAIAAVVVVSLLIQLALLFTGGADANSGSTGETEPVGVRLVRLFSYFTIQSNLIVLAAALTLARDPHADGTGWRVLRLDALLGILITGLVFAIVLAPELHLTGGALVATIGFHYVVPWATILVWLVYGPRPRIEASTIAWALVWPVLWLVYIFVQGTFTDWYPYPFVDVTSIGFVAAARNAGVVVVIGLVLALLLALADRYLPPAPRARVGERDRQAGTRDRV